MPASSEKRFFQLAERNVNVFLVLKNAPDISRAQVCKLNLNILADFGIPKMFEPRLQTLTRKNQRMHCVRILTGLLVHLSFVRILVHCHEK